MATNTVTSTAKDTKTAADVPDTEYRPVPENTEQNPAPVSLDVTVKPIEPRGKLIGFATVTFGGAVTIPDFRIFNGEKGLFVTPPSVKDSSFRSGYRDTARLTGDEIKNQLNVVVRDAYVEEVQKLQARAAAVLNTPDKPRIKDQLEKAGAEAAQDNAARPAPEKGKTAPAHDDR